MPNRNALVIAIVSGILAVGGWELLRRSMKDRGAEVHATSEDILDALAVKSLPVEKDDLLQFTGIYAWKWKLGRPTTPHQITFGYTTKDGKKQILMVPIPTKRADSSETTDLMVLLQFDAPEVGESKKLTCLLAVGGGKHKVIVDNPFKGSGQMNVISHAPIVLDGRIVLMKVSPLEKQQWTELGLFITPTTE